MDANQHLAGSRLRCRTLYKLQGINAKRRKLTDEHKKSSNVSWMSHIMKRDVTRLKPRRMKIGLKTEK